MGKNSKIKAMALSGGGAHTISYIGIWKFIYDEKGYIPDLITGTSGGALFGCFMAAGIKAETIKSVLIDIKPWKYFPLRPMKWISHLFSEWGALDIEKIKESIHEIMEKYNISWDSFERTEFRCVVADLTHGTYKYVPDQVKMPLDTAITSSIAIPFIFEPIWYPSKGKKMHCYVDGGLCEGFPIRCALYKKKYIKIMAVSPFDPKVISENPIEAGIQYPKAMYKTLLNSQKEMTLHFLDKKRGDVEFYCGSKAKNGLDFTKETIERNFQVGYDFAKKHEDKIDLFFS